MTDDIIGQKARRLKRRGRGRSGQARASKVARRRRRNGRRRVRQVVPRRCLLTKLVQPLEVALRMAIDSAKETSWFPQLTMLGFLLSCLVFHVLGLSSLRDVVGTIGHLPGLRLGPVCRSTLSDALNSKRRLKVIRQVFSNLVCVFRQHCSSGPCKLKRVAALDSTILHCVASAVWAKYRKTVNACKAHILFDIGNRIPDKFVLSEGRVHDRKCFSCFLRKGWTYVVDRAYIVYALFDHMIETGIFFVTRMKVDAVFAPIERNRVSRSQKKKGVVEDEIGYLGTGPNLMRHRTRLVTYRDQEGKLFRFLTNRLDLAPATIAAIYHERWAIEIFFKWLKRTLKGERFLARSDAAAEIHVFIALIVDILLKILAQDVTPSPSPQFRRHVPVKTLRTVRDYLFHALTKTVLSYLQATLE